jgi:hypothetical protein
MVGPLNPSSLYLPEVGNGYLATKVISGVAYLAGEEIARKERGERRERGIEKECPHRPHTHTYTHTERERGREMKKGDTRCQ